MAHIAKGQDPGNSISLLGVNPLYSNESNYHILQESYRDVSGSLVIYAPVDIPAMNLICEVGIRLTSHSFPWVLPFYLTDQRIGTRQRHRTALLALN
ncbi:unnamed protein product [Sphagnum troendelagicum]|uniref:HD-Zip IV C-terminal domain-containing protein n=1 Tax=Sphagnum troendelagicum TaxID=128251 RepID=A0ABP0UUS6_9BRYO